MTHMDAVETVEQLRASSATGLGMADGAKPEVQRIRRDMVRRAFPVIYPPDPAEDADA